jgi:hypothetical protein
MAAGYVFANTLVSSSAYPTTATKTIKTSDRTNGKEKKERKKERCNGPPANQRELHHSRKAREADDKQVWQWLRVPRMLRLTLFYIAPDFRWRGERGEGSERE